MLGSVGNSGNPRQIEAFAEREALDVGRELASEIRQRYLILTTDAFARAPQQQVLRFAQNDSNPDDPCNPRKSAAELFGLT